MTKWLVLATLSISPFSALGAPDEEEATAYFMTNRLNAFQCTNGKLALQSGDFITGPALNELAEEIGAKMDALDQQLKTGQISEAQHQRRILEIEKEASSRRHSIGRPKTFALTYEGGVLTGIKIDSPACEFRVDQAGVTSLTDSEECRVTGPTKEAEVFLKGQGLDLRAATSCCHSSCKNHISKLLRKPASVNKAKKTAK